MHNETVFNNIFISVEKKNIISGKRVYNDKFSIKRH